MDLSHLSGALPGRAFDYTDLASTSYSGAVWNELRLRAEYDGIKKALTASFTRHYTTLFENGEFDAMVPRLKLVREAAEAISDKRDCPEWFLLTVNADYLRKSFDDLKTCVEKIISKKWITEYHYSFEQRGRTPEEVGKGYHAHILIKRDLSKTKYSEMLRELKSSASKVCDAANPEIFNVRKLWDSDDVSKAYNYVIGDKDTTGAKAYKAEAIQNDSIWRSTMGIESLYESCPFSPTPQGEEPVPPPLVRLAKNLV